MAIKITDEIRARIDKAQRKTEEDAAKQLDPYKGMSEEEISDVQGVVIDSDDENALEDYIKEHCNDEKESK